MTDLPPGFEDLTPLVEGGWVLPTETLRYARRRASNPEELKAVYDLLAPRMEAVLAHVNGYSLDALPAPEEALFQLALMMAEVSIAVEKYRANPTVFVGLDASRFVALHDRPDRA